MINFCYLYFKHAKKNWQKFSVRKNQLNRKTILAISEKISSSKLPWRKFSKKSSSKYDRSKIVDVLYRAFTTNHFYAPPRFFPWLLWDCYMRSHHKLQRDLTLSSIVIELGFSDSLACQHLCFVCIIKSELMRLGGRGSRYPSLRNDDLFKTMVLNL